ncbi:hypothetical protein BLX88_20960, partial [Bacillus obstructivus]
VQRHDLLDLVRILLGEIHRDVAAIGMADHRQLAVVRVRLTLLHLLDREFDVGDAALILRQAPDIELADLGHHRPVRRQVVLNADGQIAARGEHVREEGIFGEFDGIAMIEDRNRKLD